MSDIDAALLGYLAKRAADRENRVNYSYGVLSDRERNLVREAAVMGYVQGARAANPTKKPDIPGDAAIIRLVIDACRAFPDLYPTISSLADDYDEGGGA